MKDEWIFYKEVDFNDKSILQYHIDTRDFHCLVLKEPKILPEKNSDKYLFSGDEVKSLLDRFFEESGGKGEWRFLSLKNGEDYSEWLKYIRIIRQNKGLVIWDRHNKKCFSKQDLSHPVNQDKEILNHY